MNFKYLNLSPQEFAWILIPILVVASGMVGSFYVIDYFIMTGVGLVAGTWGTVLIPLVMYLTTVYYVDLEAKIGRVIITTIGLAATALPALGLYYMWSTVVLMLSNPAPPDMLFITAFGVFTLVLAVTAVFNALLVLFLVNVDAFFNGSQRVDNGVSFDIHISIDK